MGLPTVTVHRWTRTDYERMVNAGVFQSGDRLELVGGEIIDMTPQSTRHAVAVQLVCDVLGGILESDYCLRSQMPLAVSVDSEPEPDVAVVRGTPRDYIEGHPRTALLVVEVPDTSLDYDREVKSPLYAACGIPEYWIVNLADEELIVFADPEEGQYTSQMTLHRGQTVSPAFLPPSLLPVESLMP